MRQLTCRVATKEADAKSLGSYCFCKLDSGVCSIRCRMFSIVPILAEQTVKCTSSIKYSQIQIALFCSRLICPFGIAGAGASSTHPVSYTVGWQRVIIPGYYSLFGSTTHQVPIFISSHTTVASSANRYPAIVLAELALCAFRGRWWQSRKAKFPAACSVNFLKLHQTLTVSVANTFCTKPQYLGYVLRDPVAFSACGHNCSYPDSQKSSARKRA